MASGPALEDDKSTRVLAFATTIAAASSVLVLLRLYTRIYVIRAFGRDDFSLIVAWVRCDLAPGCMWTVVSADLWSRFSSLACPAQ